jgi:D-beta-D-heptose 7-phosphate kinase/D-beta-D-heptose 1-phosphate adenosyltransferase
MDIQQQKQYNVLLIGDSCQDVYHFGTCDRISLEAPVPILKEKYTESRAGMAGNVKSNLESFGINIDFFTNKKQIKKHRFIDIKTNAHLLRVDEGEIKKLRSFAADIDKKSYDAVVLSDYDKGFLSPQACEELTHKFYNLPVFIDSKKKDLSCFHKSIIKLNEQEYRKSNHGCSNSEIIVTMGSDGAMYKGKKFPTTKIDVHDVCGAGDVFLASLVFGFLKTKDLEKAIVYANKLASLSVTKFGTYVLTKEEISDICV